MTKTNLYAVITNENTLTATIQNETIQAVNITAIGEKGDKGAPGDATDAVDRHYAQSFDDLTEVLVTHNLEKYPAVTVIDSANDEVETDVFYQDVNNLILRFSAPFSGQVFCN